MLKLANRKEMARAMFHGTGCELGVDKGAFATFLASLDSIDRLYLIDYWGPYPGGSGGDPVYYNWGDGDLAWMTLSVRFSRSDKVHVVRALFDDVCPLVANESLDFVYLDGCHKSDVVLHDLRNWWPKVKSGGVLSGHDYANTGRFPWIDVRLAVDAFCAEVGVSIECITEEECGSFLIRKPSTTPD